MFYKHENNTIGDLKDTNGNVFHEDKEKAMYLFEQIFGGADNTCPPETTTEHHRSDEYKNQLDTLNKPITMVEIKVALSKLKSAGKSAD